MRRIAWSADEHAALESTFTTTTDRRLRDWWQAVLMAARGRKRTEIAQDLHVHRSLVILWRHRALQRGLDGLHLRGAPGTTRRIPKDLVPTLPGWGKHGPQSCGLDRANWTEEERAASLSQHTGIDVKRSAM